MKILRAAAHKRMPWKNGGGVTTEITVHPEGASLGSFDWRLSMATVSADGPFSLFAGIDRTLSVLEGEGILLSVDGLADARLTRATAPFAFPADRQASARLIGGPILDFNVMTRRDGIDHRVERIDGRRQVAPESEATTVIFCGSGTAVVTCDRVNETLAVHDAAILDAVCDVTPATGADVYLVKLTRST